MRSASSKIQGVRTGLRRREIEVEMGKPRLAMSVLGAILAPKTRLQEWSRLVQISEYLDGRSIWFRVSPWPHPQGCLREAVAWRTLRRCSASERGRTVEADHWRRPRPRIRCATVLDNNGATTVADVELRVPKRNPPYRTDAGSEHCRDWRVS